MKANELIDWLNLNPTATVILADVSTGTTYDITSFIITKDASDENITVLLFNDTGA